MGQLIITQRGKEDLISEAWSWGNLSVRLFKSNTVVDKNTVLADVTIADYSGYVAQFPVFDAATTGPSGEEIRVMNSLTFAHSGGGTANDIYGLVFVNIVHGEVVACKRFDFVPATFAGGGDFRVIDCVIDLDQI